jgi:hypothetical protein
MRTVYSFSIIPLVESLPKDGLRLKAAACEKGLSQASLCEAHRMCPSRSFLILCRDYGCELCVQSLAVAYGQLVSAVVGG